jgi:hypothetical protein
MSDFPSILGTLPGWITALASSGIFAAWLRYLIQHRKQDGERLSDLERENRQLRIDFDEYRARAMKDADEYRAKCEKETEKQRELIAGLRSQLTQFQQSQVAILERKADK